MRKAAMMISIVMPPGVADNPVTGPPVVSYLKGFVSKWRGLGQTMPRDSVVRADYSTFDAASSVKSVVAHESWQTVGDFPKNAYHTWTFDTATGSQLDLADLVRPDVDALSAIPPIAQPFLISTLDQAAPPHVPGSYPFVASEWAPNSNGLGFSDNYQAFTLTGDELIVYMPSAPMQRPRSIPRDQHGWSMDGGTVIMRVPRSALGLVLRRT